MTVNRPVPLAISVPVEMVTFDAPSGAVPAIVSVAVRCVASITEMALAVTPVLLKVTAGAAWVKWVREPVMATPVSV